MRDIMMSFCCLESDNYLVIHSKEWMIHRCVCALAHDVIVCLPFGGTGRPDWSSRKENTFINQDIPSKAASLSSAHGHVPLAKPGEKVHFFSQNRLSLSASSEFLWAPYVFRDLKIAVFRHFPRTANVKKSRDQGLAVRYAVWGSRLYG